MARRSMAPEVTIDDFVNALKHGEQGKMRGRIAGTDFNIPSLERIDFQAHQGAIIARSKAKSNNTRTVLGIYPEPEDASAFMMSKIREGYKEFFPGAVSVLIFVMSSIEWKVIDMQNLYKQPFDTSLEDAYRDSRNILLEYMFSMARERRICVVSYEMKPEQMYTPDAKSNKFKAIGKRYGYLQYGKIDTRGFFDKEKKEKVLLELK
jgi:hypothetical protein